MWPLLKSFTADVAKTFTLEGEKVINVTSTPWPSDKTFLSIPRLRLPPPASLSAGDDVLRPCRMDETGQSNDGSSRELREVYAVLGDDWPTEDTLYPPRRYTRRLRNYINAKGNWAYPFLDGSWPVDRDNIPPPPHNSNYLSPSAIWAYPVKPDNWRVDRRSMPTPPRRNSNDTIPPEPWANVILGGDWSSYITSPVTQSSSAPRALRARTRPIFSFRGVPNTPRPLLAIGLRPSNSTRDIPYPPLAYTRGPYSGALRTRPTPGPAMAQDPEHPDTFQTPSDFAQARTSMVFSNEPNQATADTSGPHSAAVSVPPGLWSRSSSTSSGANRATADGSGPPNKATESQPGLWSSSGGSNDGQSQVTADTSGPSSASISVPSRLWSPSDTTSGSDLHNEAPEGPHSLWSSSRGSKGEGGLRLRGGSGGHNGGGTHNGTGTFNGAGPYDGAVQEPYIPPPASTQGLLQPPAPPNTPTDGVVEEQPVDPSRSTYGLAMARIAAERDGIVGEPPAASSEPGSTHGLAMARVAAVQQHSGTGVRTRPVPRRIPARSPANSIARSRTPANRVRMNVLEQMPNPHEQREYDEDEGDWEEEDESDSATLDDGSEAGDDGNGDGNDDEPERSGSSEGDTAQYTYTLPEFQGDIADREERLLQLRFR
ncbi:hypothetical protein HD806DRAFT_550705 [Xylariaceae sp. AK1471]|nr:hypothetical protein HD806DRAFT_550705 [Xylariaceae sp. AK1471]